MSESKLSAHAAAMLSEILHNGREGEIVRVSVTLGRNIPEEVSYQLAKAGLSLERQIGDICLGTIEARKLVRLTNLSAVKRVDFSGKAYPLIAS
jgi:hypothetical protein